MCCRIGARTLAPDHDEEAAIGSARQEHREFGRNAVERRADRMNLEQPPVLVDLRAADRRDRRQKLEPAASNQPSTSLIEWRISCGCLYWSRNQAAHRPLLSF